jgi:pimeloyl-ACP methyl ester carboxylesterase
VNAALVGTGLTARPPQLAASSSVLICQNILVEFERVAVPGNPGHAQGTNGWTGSCPAVQHPSDARAVVHRPEASTMYFPDTRSRPLTFSTRARKALPIAAGVVVAAVASALLNRWLAKNAERRNPPRGRFVTVEGVRLHYVERGTGTPLVLLHGNGSMIEDFQSSGLIDLAAKQYRVIAIDRPGFGHSDRPRSTVWTPEVQADFIAAALKKIGVPRAIVLGHSWGTLVAVALALKYPQEVQALVLASGYYYPDARADVVILSPPALPLIGDLLSHTLSPLLSRLMWPLLLRKIFGPSPVPEKFQGFPEEMAVRPSKIRASAAESALMIPSAHILEKQYRLLQMPVAIVAGAEDRLIESEQSVHLHRDIPHSTLRSVPGTGHMVHQTATAEVMSAIDLVAGQYGKPAVAMSVA